MSVAERAEIVAAVREWVEREVVPVACRGFFARRLLERHPA